MDRADLLGRVLALLAAYDVQYCVIGGQAVNAYVDPVVSLDLDIVVAVEQDVRYATFPARARRQIVLGVDLPVASLEDTLRGKVWAALDPERRASKRQKDLADIARLLEAYPLLRSLTPPAILDRLL